MAIVSFLILPDSEIFPYTMFSSGLCRKEIIRNNYIRNIDIVISGQCYGCAHVDIA